jgi:hypothetical protein
MRNSQLLTAVALCMVSIFLAIVTPAILVQSQEVSSDAANSREARALDLKFIDAELALAKANLEYVLEMNKKRAVSYSLIFIEELRLRIKLYEEWGKQLEAENPQFVPIAIQKAKGELKIAQMRLDADEKLRAQIPTSVSESQLHKSQLSVEVAKAWLAKVSHPSFHNLSREKRFQWRFVVLGKELLELRLERQRK